MTNRPMRPGAGRDRPMMWLMNDDGTIKPAETMRQWALDMFPNAHRRVAYDAIGPFEVSTVFTGIDVEMRGPPMVFETMVFRDNDVSRPRRTIRNPTREEALETHAALVEEYQEMSSS